MIVQYKKSYSLVRVRVYAVVLFLFEGPCYYRAVVFSIRFRAGLGHGLELTGKVVRVGVGPTVTFGTTTGGK